MNRNEIKAFVTKKLAEMSSSGGILAEHVLLVACELHDEIAKQNTKSFVDQLQSEGWTLKEVHTTHKVWGPDDTYENLEFQVFEGPGRYQVFTRPKPGEIHAQGSDLTDLHVIDQ